MNYIMEVDLSKELSAPVVQQQIETPTIVKDVYLLLIFH